MTSPGPSISLPGGTEAGRVLWVNAAMKIQTIFGIQHHENPAFFG